MTKSRLLCVLLVLVGIRPVLVHASSAIVISQVYGGGGNSGSTLRNDFVELLNRSTVAVSVDGWTIQYASSAGSTWDRTVLSGSIQPGAYYLIALAAGAGGSLDLPTAQISGSTNLSATTGKIALVNNSTLLTGTCPTGFVDFVGYGAANCSEGNPAAALTNTTALVRASNGCADTDSNAADFVAASPSPRNASSTVVSCGAITTDPNPSPTPGPGPTTGPTPVRTIGGAPLIFPQFAQGGGYQTSFTFNNLSTTAATITLTFYAPAGTLINSTTLGVTGLGSVRTAMVGTTLSVGWASASMSPPVDLSGTETIQLFSSSGSLVNEASVLEAQRDTVLRLPVFEKDGFGTGVAFANPTGASVTTTLTLRNGSGVTVGTSAITLGPSQQTAKFVFELFPGTSNFEGMLELTAPRELAAIALRQNLVTGIFSTLPVSPTPIETFFSPNAGASTRIVQEIERSLSTIDVAIYSFTLDAVADALIAAKTRGVQIRILADSSQANGTGSEIARLEAAGFQLKRVNGTGGGILHDKYAIIDGRILVTGSYNWSNNAEENNDENAVFIRNSSVIAAFQSNFNSMWSSR